MNNLSKKIKIPLLLLITFLVIALIILLIDVILTESLNKEDLEETVSSNVIDPTEKESTPSNVSFNLKESIAKVFELMNEKKYEDLYILLEDDFRKEKFDNSITNFTSFMEFYADKSYTPIYSKYSKSKNMYIINVEFMDYSNSDDDIINPKKSSKIDTFIINFSNNNNFTFSFLGYIGSKELKTGKENSLFNVILNKTVLYNDSAEFYFTITNKGDFPISITKDQISCETSAKTWHYTNDITIAPNSSTDICFKIGIGFSMKFILPDSISFKDITVGDNTYSFDIKTKYCLDK